MSLSFESKPSDNCLKAEIISVKPGKSTKQRLHHKPDNCTGCWSHYGWKTFWIHHEEGDWRWTPTKIMDTENNSKRNCNKKKICRVRVVNRGQKQHAWTMEQSTGHWTIQRWKQRKTRKLSSRWNRRNIIMADTGRVNELDYWW